VNIKKIDSVTLPVTDLKRSATFHADTLGLEEIWRQDENKGIGSRATLEGKGVKFEGARLRRLLRRARSAHAKQMSAAGLREYTIEHGEG
jgi:catechol-2,3-dioxygenase